MAATTVCLSTLAECWRALATPHATGLKLRLGAIAAVPDTAVVCGGVLRAWLRSSKGGAVEAVPRSELSVAALLARLSSQHSQYEPDNPAGVVAVAHFSNGLAQLVDAAQLAALLSRVHVGAVPAGCDGSGGPGTAGACCCGPGEDEPELQLVQSYVPPAADGRSGRPLRFLTTFGGAEGAACATQARCYSDRYMLAPSPDAAAQAAAAALEQPCTAARAGSCCGSVASLSLVLAPAGSAACASAAASPRAGGVHEGAADAGSGAEHEQAGSAAAAATAAGSGCDELQLRAWRPAPGCDADACNTPSMARTAAGSFAGTSTGCASTGGGSSTCGGGGTSCGGAACGGTGCGGTGCGSLQAAPGTVARAAAAAVQALMSHLDKAHGWRIQGLVAEFVQDARKPEQLWLTGLHNLTLAQHGQHSGALSFTERCADFLAGGSPPPAPALPQHSSFGRPQPPAQPAAGTGGSPALPEQQPGAAPASPTSSCEGSRQRNRDFFPGLRSGSSSSSGGNAPHQQQQQQQQQQAQQHSSCRPVSAPRSTLRSPSPRPGSASPQRARPGTAVAASSSGGGGAARLAAGGAAAPARPGAGGNPMLRTSIGDAYQLFLRQPLRPSDSVTAQLAAQLEAAREQAQQYACAAQRALLVGDSATAQAAQQVAAVQQELLHLRSDAAAAGHERRELQAQLAALAQQRNAQATALAALQAQFADVQGQLGADRATLATMLRQHQQREQQLQEEGAALQAQNAELRGSHAALAARLDEESEVVSALRAQLVDYKLMLGQLQLASKKGRGLIPSTSTSGLRRGGSVTPSAQLSHAGGTAPAAARDALLCGGGGGLGPEQPGQLRRLDSQQPRQAAGALSSWQQLASAGAAKPSSVCSSRRSTIDAAAAGLAACWPAPPQQQRQQPAGTSSCGAPPAPPQQRAAQRAPQPATGEAAPGPTAAAALGAAGADPASGSMQQGQPPRRGQGAPGQAPPRPPTASKPKAPSPQGKGRSCSRSSSGGGRAPLPAHASEPAPSMPNLLAAMAAELGQPLAAPGSAPPSLIIGDLLLGEAGMLDPSAQQQLGLVASLLQEVAGDLNEVYVYYALLGASRVVADRLVMDLLQFGKLAFDCDVSQDYKSLSAVEDAFFTLSDRQPCRLLAAATGADGSTRAASGRAGSPPPLPPPEHDGEAAHAPALLSRERDLIVPEQFPEALVRLACVRYRWGCINLDYDWSASSSSEDDGGGDDGDGAQGAAWPPTSRSARLQHCQQQRKHKRGPKVLRPEGGAASSGGGGSASRPGSPARGRAAAGEPGGGGGGSRSASRPPYAPPSQADDLLAVVRTFLQREVLACARRSKLAGSPLGQRRARDKPSFQGWATLPAASLLQD